MSNKKTSRAGACLPACKRGCALLAEDFANNALDCLFVRSYIFQLDSRRELEADIMGFGDACSRVQGVYAFFFRFWMRFMTRVIQKPLKTRF